jgi:polar amino acid transport system ATP-binding protein
MEKGRLTEKGSPAELLAPGSRSRTAEFCAKLVELMGRE